MILIRWGRGGGDDGWMDGWVGERAREWMWM